MRFLRSNTAVIITVGPFYDKTDGVTIEGALTITNERITLTADTDAGSAPTNILDNITGATAATNNDLNYITGNDAGYMQLELAAADVNRVGRMNLSITDAANHVPVFHEFMVLPQAIYDWLIAGTIIPLPANVTQWLGSAAATPTVAGVPEVDVTHWIGTAAATPTVAGVPEVDLTHIAGATTDVSALATNVAAILVDTGTTLDGRIPAALVGGRIDANVGAISSDATAADNAEAFFDGTGYAGTGNVIPTVTTVTTTTTATNVTTVNGLAANVITAASIAADAGVEIAGAVWNEDATGHQTTGTFGQAIGDPVADTNTIYKAVVTDATGATVGVDVVALKTETAAILVDTGTTLDGRIPTALVSGRMDSSVGAMATNVLTASAINADAITDAKVASDVTIASVTGAVGSVTGAVGSVTGAVGSVTGAVGSVTGNVGGNVSGSVASVVGAVGSVTGAVGSVTGAVGSVTGNVTGSIGSLAAQAKLDVNAEADTALADYDAPTFAELDARTDAIDTALVTIDDALDTEIPAIITAVDDLEGRLTAGLAAKLAAHVAAVLVVAVGAGSTTTAVKISLLDGGAPSATNDFYNGRVIVFTSGVLAGQATSITDYVGATTTATVVALTSAPAEEDSGVIV